MTSLTPQEIVDQLDHHIVGQSAAKRAVAIALRNRWRRSQVEPGLRNEITPKNIRIRKRFLKEHERKRASRDAA